MSNRLTKIITKTGDSGITGLGDGSRIAKDHPRIEVIGTIDELNSALGIVASCDLPANIQTLIASIQQDLFELGAELCLPETHRIDEAQIIFLEQHAHTLNSQLAPLKEFILPGGTPASAYTHLARSICRRAERCLVTLAKAEPVSHESLVYLNRLSDLLFIVARTLNCQSENKEMMWEKQHP